MNLPNLFPENKNKLYLLHIPKTGGTSVAASVRHALTRANLAWHANSRPPHCYGFSNYSFIDAHLGNTNKIIDANTTVACLVRHPVDRAISNFLWIHDSVLSKKSEYKHLSKIDDRLRFYLFKDENYITHRNIQSKFICNSAQSDVFDAGFNYSYEDYSKTWFIEQTDVSPSEAIKVINEFGIIGTTDRHQEFMFSVIEWFDKNLNLQIKKTDIEVALKSEIDFNGNEVTTERLIQLLSSGEYEFTISLNEIDFDIYNDVLSKSIKLQ